MDFPLWATIVVVIGLIFTLLALGMWVGFVLAVVGIIVLTFFAGGKGFLVSSMQFIALNSVTLAAIPMYIFVGEVLLKSGLANNLYRGVSKVLGVLPGGLAHSNIGACAIFAAISGSSVATAATIGTVALHEQELLGYNRKLIFGSIAAGGTLGILIPPSITMIVYGAFVEVSVARLFIGGIIPGIILAALFMFWIGIVGVIRPHWTPRQRRISWGYIPQVFSALRELWPMLLLIIIIMGGIYGGVMSPTAAAGIASVVALVIVGILGRLNFQLIKEATMASVRTSNMILFLLVGAKILALSISMIKLPARLTEFVLMLDADPLIIWVALIFLYLALGCFLDGFSLMVVTLPVIFPLIVGLGFDPIWFGVLLTILIECALLTPPVGFNLYVIHGLSGGQHIGDLLKGVVPFFLILLVSIALYTVQPKLVTWLPATMFDMR
ncbi:TRAP transporter large permease [Chloroflexota bacterium]